MGIRYLVTGVAGSGKTTLEKVFRDKGYVTADIDDGFAEWRHRDSDELLDYTPDQPGWHDVAEWTVKADKLQRFFDNHSDEIVLVFGSFARQHQVVGIFDKIILLEYPNIETAKDRIFSRQDGYGKHPGELARIIGYVGIYQDIMKSAGAVIIDCTLPIEQSICIIEDMIREGIDQ